MTGEMSQSEVTRDNYPELFALHDALKRRGIESTPRPFDQYQGPFLRIPKLGSVWYSQDMDAASVYTATGRPVYPGGLWIIETGGSGPGRPFQSHGAHHVHEGQGEWPHGCYTLRQAARHIARIVGQTDA